MLGIQMSYTTSNFIKQSIAKFGHKFKYDKTIYVNATTNVNIYCTEHKYNISILPNNHLNSKDGCNQNCKLHGTGLKRQEEFERCKTEGKVYIKHRCSRCKGEMNDFFKNLHDECKEKNKKSYQNRTLSSKTVVESSVPDNNAQDIQVDNIDKTVDSNQTKKSTDTEALNNICEYIHKDGTECVFKRRKGCRWCGKHMRKGKIEDEIKNGVKRCSNWIRSCDNILTDDVWNTCLTCRKKDREEDKKRRKWKKKQLSPQCDVKSLLGIKYCTGCKKDKPKKGFTKLNGDESVLCGDCLKISREHEKNRSKRKRNYSEYESKPERKQKKKEWKTNNPDKVTQYYKDYRDRERRKDLAGFLDKNAAMQRNWRKNNPEKAKENDERWKSSDNYNISYYKTSANTKGVSFELSDEYIRKCINSECWYCGMTEPNVNIGIDRLDPDGPYSEENTKPCCSPCNYSKKDYTVSQYIGKIFDIVSYAFPEYNIATKNYVKDVKRPNIYSTSKSRAKIRGREFCLQKHEYNSLIQKSNKCYLCGDTLESGMSVDRVDNEIGYVLSNCRPCCSMCNYIKKDEQLDKFIMRCIRIWVKCKDYNLDNYCLVNQRGGSMNPRITRKLPDLSRREKAEVRNELKHTNPEWINASINDINGKADEHDTKILNNIDTKIDAEIQRRRDGLTFAPKVVKNTNSKNEDNQEERRRYERERKRRLREKKRAENPPKKRGRPKKITDEEK